MGRSQLGEDDGEWNNLSRSIDVSITEAKSLAILYLHDNSFLGLIPMEIGQTNLTCKFQANSNKLHGTLTPMLGNLLHLMVCTLGANSFSGNIPTSLGNCTELVQLNLSKNHFDSTILDNLDHLMKLSTLDFLDDNLRGTIPRSLFNILTLPTKVECGIQ